MKPKPCEIPIERLPKPLIAAWEKHVAAAEKCDVARGKYEAAVKKHVAIWDKYSANGEKYNAALEKCNATWEKYEAALEEYADALKKGSAAWLKYRAALEKYRPQIEALHSELYPDCPWDGTTIFPQKRRVP